MHRLRAKLFGGIAFSKSRNAPNANQTIQDLRKMEELLSRKQEFLEGKIAQEIQTAKQHGLGNKRAAIQALMRKRRYQKALQQLDGTLTTIELQRETLEMAHANTTVFKTMAEATKALKAAHAHLDVEQVHDVIDDITEQQEIAREISDAIANPIGFGTGGASECDEEELEKELEAMAQEELDLELLRVPGISENAESPPAQPSVSTRTERLGAKERAKSHAHAEEDEQILKELEQWSVS